MIIYLLFSELIFSCVGVSFIFKQALRLLHTTIFFSFYQQKFDKKSYLTIVNNLSKNLL